MELALQVIGLKMTGKLEDARAIAMRICGSDLPGNNTNQNAFEYSGGLPIQQLGHVLGIDDASESIETLVWKCLSLLELPLGTFDTRLAHRNKSGSTLLHLAVLEGYENLVKHLIMRGINLDVRDRCGYTALHFAVFTGNMVIAKVLVDQGDATLGLAAADGNTPYDLACLQNRGDLIALVDPWSTLLSRGRYRVVGPRLSRSSSLSSLRSALADSDGCDTEDGYFDVATNDIAQASEVYILRRRSSLVRSKGVRSQPHSRSNSPDERNPGRRSTSQSRLRANSDGDIVIKSSSERLPEKSSFSAVDQIAEYGSKARLAAIELPKQDYNDIQSSWLEVLSQTTPASWQKALADILRLSPLSQLPEMQFLQVQPIQSFQAIFPHLSHVPGISLGQSSDHNGNPLMTSLPKLPVIDNNWLNNILGGLTAPPPYEEATADSQPQVPVPVSEVGRISSPGQATTYLAKRERDWRWWSIRPFLQSQTRVTDLTPEQQREQAKLMQKPDRMVWVFWLPMLLCMIFLTMVQRLWAFVF